MSRAKCKRGSVVVERIPLLNPAAREALKSAGVKRGWSSVAERIVEVKTCVAQSGKYAGETVVKHAKVTKGRVSAGSVRERRGSAIRFPPPPPPPSPTDVMEQGTRAFAPPPSVVRPPDSSLFGGVGPFSTKRIENVRGKAVVNIDGDRARLRVPFTKLRDGQKVTIPGGGGEKARVGVDTNGSKYLHFGGVGCPPGMGCSCGGGLGCCSCK